MFLITWNIREYDKAKNQLSRELELHLEVSNNEVSNNQLRRIIQRFEINEKFPGDTTSLGMFLDSNVSLSFSADPTSLDSDQLSFHKDSLGISKIKIEDTHASVMVMWDDLLNGNNSIDSIPKFPNQSDVNFSIFDQDTLITQELELFSTEHFVTDSITLAQIQDIFAQKLEQNNLPNNFSYSSNNTDQNGLVISYPSAENHQGNLNFIFNGFSTFLLRQILPYVIFSFFLLLLVVSAFLVLIKSWRQQKELVLLKNEFISNISHELQTPISTVSVALEAVMEYDVLSEKEKMHEYLEISKKELGRLRLLVNKVLTASIFESSANKVHLSPLDLRACLDGVLQTMNMHFDRHEVNVTTSLSEGPILITGDSIHLTNVIFNLLENSLKYSSKNPEIRIQLTDLHDKALLSISDNGIGISSKDQSQIFDKFYRVPTNDKHDVKGYGLGLSYVKKVIDDFGGKIEVSSELGKGSTFSVELLKFKHD